MYESTLLHVLFIFTKDVMDKQDIPHNTLHVSLTYTIHVLQPVYEIHVHFLHTQGIQPQSNNFTFLQSTLYYNTGHDKSGVLLLVKIISVDQ
jgi:hypothetical protein